MLRTPIIAFGVAALMISCGKKDDEEKNNSSAQDLPTSAADYAVSTVAQSQIDEAIEALADGSSSTGSSLTGPIANAIRGKFGMDNPAWSSACDDGDGSTDATVTWTFNKDPDEMSKTLKIAGKSFTRTDTRARTGSLVRKWTGPEGHKVMCNTAGTHAKVEWKTEGAIAGLKMEMTTSRVKTDTSKLVDGDGAELVSVVKAFDVSGTRTLEWSADPVVDADAGTITLSKSVTASNVTRKHTVTKTVADGVNSDRLPGFLKKAQNLEITSTISVTTPLAIEIVRDSTTQVWKSRTVKTGTTLATDKDGVAIQSTFDTVKFELTDDATKDPCVPVSGTISGKVFAKADDVADASKALKSYVISFTGGTPTIAVDGGEAEEMADYKPQCDLAD